MRLPVVLALLFSLLFLTTSTRATDPVGLAYTPEGGWAGSDGVIYLLESETNEIFRWDSTSRTYLPSIPLPEPCLPIAVHSPRGPDAATSTFLITTASGRVLQYHVSGANAVAAADLALQTPGVEIQGLALIGSVPDILIAYRDPAGQKVQAITATGYSSVVSVAADTVESDWVGTLSGSVHRVFSRQIRAGAASIVARTMSGLGLATTTIGLSGADHNTRIVAGTGSEFLLASGVRKLGPDTASVVPVTGAAYYGRVLMTLRAAPGGSQLARYPLISLSNSAQLTHSTVVPGLPWGAFTTAGRVVAVTLNGGVPAFHVIDLAFQLANQFPLDLPVATATTPHRAVDLWGIASLTGSFYSSLPATYAWKKDGVILPDETSDTLTIPQAGSADSAIYTAISTNALGSAETEIILQAGPARGPGSPPANTLLVGGGPQLWQESSPLILTPFPAFPLDVLPGPDRVFLDGGLDRWGRLHLFSGIQANGRVTANTFFQSTYYPAADRWIHRRLSIPLTLVPPGNLEASILENQVLIGRSVINLETGALRLIAGTGVPRTAFTLSQWMQEMLPRPLMTAPIYGLGATTSPSPLTGGRVDLLTSGSIQMTYGFFQSPLPSPPTAGAITSLNGDISLYDLILGSAAGIMIYPAVPPPELGIPLGPPEFFIDSSAWGLGQTLTDITVTQPRTFCAGFATGLDQFAIVRYNVDQAVPEFISLPEPVLEPYTTWTGAPEEIPLSLSLPSDPAAFRVLSGSPFRLSGFLASGADPLPAATWTPEQAPAWLSVQIGAGEVVFSGTPSGPAGPTAVRGFLTHPSGTKTSVSFTIEVLANTPPATVIPELSLTRLEDADDLLIVVQELFTDAQTPSGELIFALEEIDLPAGMTASLREVSGSDQIVFKTSTNQHGAATLRLSATDPQGLSGSLLVRIQTTPVNDRPTAVPGSAAATDEDTATAITTTGTDVDGDALSYTISTPPLHGVLSGTAPNLTYTPDANFHGQDSFEFTVSDGTLASQAAAIALTVRSVNDRPTAAPGNAATDEDTATAITLTGTDVDGDALSYTISTPPLHGTLSGIAPNLTYTPDTNFHGQDSFEFTVSDGTLSSQAAAIALTVRSVNDRPTAAPGNAATDEDTATAITLTGTDVDGDALSYTISTPPLHGTLSGTAPNLTYTPDANFHGQDSFEFTVSDGTLASQAAAIALTVRSVNDRPTAAPGNAATDEDTATAITLTGTDVDGDALSYTISTPPLHGTLSGTAPNLTYTPDANFHGQDSFEFTVSDGTLASQAAAIALTVRSVNDRPTAAPGNAATDEDTATAITLTGTDVDGDALSYTISTPPLHGTLSGIAPNLTYTPDTNFHGQDSFEFTVSDGTLSSQAAAIALTVRSVNDRPTAAPGNAATDEDTATAITLTGTDVDGDALSYTISTPPLHGTLSGTAPNLTYTPDANFHGQDSFEFTVSDGTLSSQAAAIALTVRSVNDRPTAAPGNAATDEDTATAITLTGTDVDGDALSYTISTPPLHGVLSGIAANLTYTPDANFHGQDSFEFTVSDGTLSSQAAAVGLLIRPVADAPQAVGSLPEQPAPPAGDLQLAIASLFTDADGDPLQYSITTTTNTDVVAGASVDAAGNVRIAFADYSQGGQSVITVKATDPSGRFAEQQIRVTLPAPAAPKIQVVQALKLNRQTGLMELVAEITNGHTRAIGGFRATFAALPATVCLYNASDCPGGTPESVYARPVQAGETVRVVYQFYSPLRNTAWTPQLTVTPLPAQPPAAAGGGIAIDRCIILPGGALLLEFPSVPGALYQVEFLDPGANWAPVPMQMRAAGTRLQWIDRGPPATPALPAGGKSRFYRVRAL